MEASPEQQAILARLLGEQKTVNIAEIHPEMLQRDAVPVIPSQKGDPMIIPFIKEEYVRKQATERMNAAMEANNHDEARQMAQYLTRTFPGTKEAEAAQTVLTVIGTGNSDTFTPVSTPQGNEPTLPSWVAQNTKTIFFAESGSSVIVGTQICDEGDQLDEYPNVTVEEIRANEVIFKVSNDFMTKTYSVLVPTGK